MALWSGQQAAREVTPDRLSGRAIEHEVAIVLEPEVCTGIACRPPPSIARSLPHRSGQGLAGGYLPRLTRQAANPDDSRRFRIDFRKQAIWFQLGMLRDAILFKYLRVSSVGLPPLFLGQFAPSD